MKTSIQAVAAAITLFAASAVQAQNRVLDLQSGGRVNIPHHPSQNPGGTLTIEFWVMMVPGTTGWPVAKRSGSTGSYSVQIYGSNPAGSNGVLGPTYFGCSEGPAAVIPQGQWVHVAYVCQSSGGRWSYINGVLSETATLGGCTIFSTSNPLAFGAAVCCSSTQFFGRLDNIRIWSRARTAEEIASNALREFSPVQASSMPGLIGSWGFNDGSANDATGVNNGQFEGAATTVIDTGAGAAARFDCNGDGVLDTYQIAQGELADANADGVPDICQGPSCANADIYRDFNVNGADLGILLSQWGPNTPLTESDLNRDGVVNGADLGLLLSFWGACP